MYQEESDPVSHLQLIFILASVWAGCLLAVDSARPSSTKRSIALEKLTYPRAVMSDMRARTPLRCSASVLRISFIHAIDREE
ncbi:hypothetical protein KIN20_005632 [Parelaphostrongylus tenuis]|uniref:Uncharacterized protein n=1 Tax=Parelaphostrongylus tenuis TaxID=148309 RepID=A0AAD5QG95_PARTN|nr:hypothetical protein KIN20_005632 [Parelaphostrongylus tenuis]